MMACKDQEKSYFFKLAAPLSDRDFMAYKVADMRTELACRNQKGRRTLILSISWSKQTMQNNESIASSEVNAIVQIMFFTAVIIL